MKQKQWEREEEEEEAENKESLYTIRWCKLIENYYREKKKEKSQIKMCVFIISLIKMKRWRLDINNTIIMVILFCECACH